MTEGKWNNTHDEGELKYKTVWWMGRPIGNHEFTFFQLQLIGGTARASFISMFWLYYINKNTYMVYDSLYPSFQDFKPFSLLKGGQENKTQILSLTEQYKCNLTCRHIFLK